MRSPAAYATLFGPAADEGNERYFKSSNAMKSGPDIFDVVLDMYRLKMRMS